jgi:transposase-like protein
MLKVNDVMKCPRCESLKFSKNGLHRGKQKYICKACGRQWLYPVSDRGYPDPIRALCVRMHLNGLDAKQIERYTGISHNTILNWVKQSQLDDSGSNYAEFSAPADKTEVERDELVNSYFIT